jgi:integrase
MRRKQIRLWRRPPRSRSDKWFLVSRDGLICHWCGEPSRPDDPLEVDHIVSVPYIDTTLPELNVRRGFFEYPDFAAIRAQLDPWNQVVADLAYCTGWRVKAELLTLEWADIDRDQMVITLPAARSKTRKPRLFFYGQDGVVLLPHLAEAIDQAWAGRARLQAKGVVSPLRLHPLGRRTRADASRPADPELARGLGDGLRGGRSPPSTGPRLSTHGHSQPDPRRRERANQHGDGGPSHRGNFPPLQHHASARSAGRGGETRGAAGGGNGSVVWESVWESGPNRPGRARERLEGRDCNK